MSDARSVIIKWWLGSNGVDGALPRWLSAAEENTDAILAALAEAGLTPPMPTGRLHKALQDAFQAGGIEAVETLQQPGKFLTGKHIYCDKELKKLLEAVNEQ
jgi:hypothetical protein